MTHLKKMTLFWQGNYRFMVKNEKGIIAQFDSPTENGGEETALSPMENVLASLAACSSYDVISILRKKRQRISRFSAEITGERRNELPKVFTNIQIKYLIYGTQISKAAVESAINISEENCTVGQMLKNVVKVTSSFEILNE
jgi:putative redox protein